MARRTSREIKLPAWRQENKKEEERDTPQRSRKSSQKKRSRSSPSSSVNRNKKQSSNSKTKQRSSTPSSQQKRSDPSTVKKSSRPSSTSQYRAKKRSTEPISPKASPQTATTPSRPTRNWTPEKSNYESDSLHLSPSRSLAAYAMMEIASTGKKQATSESNASFYQMASPYNLNARFGKEADVNADPEVSTMSSSSSQRQIAATSQPLQHTSDSGTVNTSFDARLEATTASMGKSSRKSNKRSRKGDKLHMPSSSNEGYDQETVFQHNHEHNYNPQNQAFLVEGFPDRSDPSDKSLGSLCERFMLMFRTTKPRGISLDDAACKLGIERRRIYDVINILEAFDIVSRKEKNTYWWHGTCHLHLTLLELKEEAMNERSHLLPDRQEAVDVHPFEYASAEQIPETFHVAASDPFSSEDEQYCLEFCHADDEQPRIPNTTSSSKTSKLSERKENSMGSLARKFIQIFLLGRHVLSLEDAATLLSAPDNGGSAKLKTTVRRLYDIANVMCILRIIDKIPVPNSRKPAFQWRGMSDVPMLDGVSRRAAAAAVEGEARLSRKTKKKSKDSREQCAYADQYEDILKRIEESENQSRQHGRRLSVPEPQAPARDVVALTFFPSHAEVFGYSSSSGNRRSATVVRPTVRSDKENDVDQEAEPMPAENNIPVSSEMDYDNGDVNVLMEDGPFSTNFLDDECHYDDVFTPPFGDRDASFAFSTDKGGRQRSPPATVKQQFTSMRFQAGSAFCSPQMRGLFAEQQINVPHSDIKRQKLHEDDAETKGEVGSSTVSAAYATVGGSIPQVTSPSQDVAPSKAVDTPIAGQDATPYQFRFGNTPCTGVDTPSVSSTKKREAKEADEKISALRPVALLSSNRQGAESEALSRATDEPTAQSQTADWTTKTASENPTGRSTQDMSRPTLNGHSGNNVGELTQNLSTSSNHQTSTQTSTKGSSPCPAADLYSKFSEAAGKTLPAHTREVAADKNVNRDHNSSAASEVYDTQGFVIARRSAGSRSSNYSGRSTGSDTE